MVTVGVGAGKGELTATGAEPASSPTGRWRRCPILEALGKARKLRTTHPTVTRSSEAQRTRLMAAHIAGRVALAGPIPTVANA